MSDGQDSPGARNDGPDGLDRLARRAVDAVLVLVRRGTALAGGVLIVAVVLSLGGFLLGIAALSDGIETVWIMLGGFFMVLAIGSAILAIVRLQSVKRSADTLVTEVRTLISGDIVTQQTVIETVESTDGVQNEGVVVLSRQFSSMRDAVGGRTGQFRALTSALAAVTSFPGLIAIATVVSFVFLGLSLIFLLALAL